MTLLDFILLLIVAGIAGAIGQAIGGFSYGGCIVAILVGFIGAFIGTWIARQFGLPTFFVIQIGNESFPVIWAIIGAAILSAVLGLIFRRRWFYA
ncbi:MAG TPA: GlsB/YeaQ/YmgE family stress response membrane protein [Anaerolineae bacterium]|nr:GlsB/YeaQ/YmgE family stress response membrane protein [Anaerolineae bacterium]